MFHGFSPVRGIAAAQVTDPQRLTDPSRAIFLFNV